MEYCNLLPARVFPLQVWVFSHPPLNALLSCCSYMMGCLYVDREASARKRGSAASAHTDNGSANGSAGSDSDATAAQPRVSDAVRRRMDDVATGRLPGTRPLLLFPEGTTTNGRYLLPFKTGAFLAGQPLQPVVIRYGEVSAGAGQGSQSRRAPGVVGWHQAGRIAQAGFHADIQAGWQAGRQAEPTQARSKRPLSSRIPPPPTHPPPIPTRASPCRTACPQPGR